jgi:hypothetical protein
MDALPQGFSGIFPVAGFAGGGFHLSRMGHLGRRRVAILAGQMAMGRAGRLPGIDGLDPSLSAFAAAGNFLIMAGQAIFRGRRGGSHPVKKQESRKSEEKIPSAHLASTSGTGRGYGKLSALTYHAYRWENHPSPALTHEMINNVEELVREVNCKNGFCKIGFVNLHFGDNLSYGPEGRIYAL